MDDMQRLVCELKTEKRIDKYTKNYFQGGFLVIKPSHQTRMDYFEQ